MGLLNSRRPHLRVAGFLLRCCFETERLSPWYIGWDHHQVRGADILGGLTPTSWLRSDSAPKASRYLSHWQGHTGGMR